MILGQASPDVAADSLSQRVENIEHQPTEERKKMPDAVQYGSHDIVRVQIQRESDECNYNDGCN